MQDLDDLKNEASSLGIKYNAKIGFEKLKEKVEQYYTEQETSGAEVEKLVAKNEKLAEKKVPTGDSSIDSLHRKNEKEARATKIVTIIDNDQRVNNNTTTCVASCACEFYDLGTRILPLNEKIEVCQGHLNVIKESMIPMHVKDNKTGLSKRVQRPRYSVHVE